MIDKNVLIKMKAKAEELNGKCLSVEYFGTRVKYEWECSKGHRWLATWNSIQDRPSWCPDCGGRKKLTIEKLQNFAISKGGRLLSTVYVNVDTHYDWQCAKGHIWSAECTNVIHNGHWCPQCACNRPKTLEDLQAAALKLGGKLIDLEYNGMLSFYTWECCKRHRWIGNANNVVNHHHWCRRCSLKRHSKPETEVYEWVLSIYPDALHSVSRLLPNRRFEIDIYIPSLSKAIEYDGDYWHSSASAKDRDRRKELQCKEVGIKMMRVDDLTYRRNRDGEKAKILAFLTAD